MPVGVVIGVCSALLTSLVTEIYCHRCLAHRAFRLHPGLAFVLDTHYRVTAGAHPETWAAIHRMHHRYADTPLDPHSPRQRPPASVLLGTAGLFALARRRLPVEVSRGTGAGPLVLRVLLFAFFFVTVGLVQLLTMLAVHVVGHLGLMGAVNSVGHLYGRKPHPESSGYDLAWLSIPLLGHGYHNSHHAHPAAARTGRLDPVWPLLRLLDAVGLVDLEARRAGRARPACCAASAS